jgi:hypothetical protein
MSKTSCHATLRQAQRDGAARFDKLSVTLLSAQRAVSAFAFSRPLGGSTQ